ncbi:MAG: hypothetical protein IPL99_19275 [Candidatus Competibacteraceae bacterium]|nr:hypothetical protein [Candidatus Competibacteraceae bacterium]
MSIPLADGGLGDDAIPMGDQGLDAWPHTRVSHREPILLRVRMTTHASRRAPQARSSSRW